MLAAHVLHIITYMFHIWGTSFKRGTQFVYIVLHIVSHVCYMVRICYMVRMASDIRPHLGVSALQTHP